MSDINRIELLEQKLNAQLKKSKTSLKITFIVYLIITIFVIAYTSYITLTFEDLATPSTVAELLVMQTENTFPEINSYLDQNSQTLANSFAIDTVDYVRSMVPSLGLLVQMQFDVLVDSVNKEFSSKYLPIIDDYFKTHKSEIIKNINTMSDENVAKILAEELMGQINFELIDINNQFTNAMLKFKSQVNKLAYTPSDKLTRRELAHKKAIAYWMYLLKHAETGKLKL